MELNNTIKYNIQHKQGVPVNEIDWVLQDVHKIK